jgi:hypothetical protein
MLAAIAFALAVQGFKPAIAVEQAWNLHQKPYLSDLPI